MDDKNMYESIPQEKFAFVNEGERISDRKFADKPIGFFRDAFNRFAKSKISVVAAIIIILLMLFSVITPLVITTHDNSFMVNTYAKMAPRLMLLHKMGIDTGFSSESMSEKLLIKYIGVGVAAEGWDGKVIKLGESMSSEYQPILKITGSKTRVGADKKESTTYDTRYENYYGVGFIYKSIQQSEYDKIVAWEKETGKHILYPLVENNEYNQDPQDANFWYKSVKGQPVRTDASTGNVKKLSYSEDLKLEDNYKRDADGNLVYYEYTGGGTVETAQFKVRVLYYNYFQYLYGYEPDYLMGTDSQGYDLAIRLASGLRLSLGLAFAVFFINFVLGAIYGAVSGYYGGVTDLVMERIAEILYDVPFVVVATLFQIHLAGKVGPVMCLLFAFVATGWIGTSGLVRTQFYRFKNQEYVMAARTLGARDARVIWKHIFPNTLGTIVTACALSIPSVIYSESMLSFLGIAKLGGASGTSLGTLLSDASAIWTKYPHLMIFPALTLSLLMICFNLFSNGLRDAFNPALRGSED